MALEIKDTLLLEYVEAAGRTVDISGKDFDGVLDECLALTECRERALDGLLQNIRESLGGRRLALYGVQSPVAISVMRLLWERAKLRVACLCDQHGSSGEFLGVRVVDPATLGREYADATVMVCSSTGEGDNATGILASLGFPQDRVFPWEWVSTILKINPSMLFDPHKPMNPYKSLEKHLPRYHWAYDLFEDDLSKKTVLAWLRKSLCATTMDIPSPCEKYFEDGWIALRDGEVFVDGGAYSGDSVLDFVRHEEQAKVRHAHIYSFEPGKVHYGMTIKNTAGIPDVTVVPKGLWDRETELRFLEQNEWGMGSSFAENVLSNQNAQGTIVESVPVTSLDTFFAGRLDSELPTLIKMDIEGSEREALMGGADIIRRVKPRLVICAYHKPEDLYVLPQTIMRIRDDYRFCLRQHAPELHEIILYGV